MLIVRTSDGDEIEHDDSSTWTLTGDGGLVLLSAPLTTDQAGNEDRSMAEYAGGRWTSVRKGPKNS